MPRKGRMQGVLFSSARTGGSGDERDRWATPPELFDPLHREFDFAQDVAALADSRRVPDYLGPDHADPACRDALFARWRSPAWCNPPYSQAADFLRVAQSHAATGGVVVVLVFARLDTDWWWLHVWGRDRATRERIDGLTCATETRWRPGRVRFLDPATGRPRVGEKGQVQAAPAPSVAVVYRGRCLADWPANGVL